MKSIKRNFVKIQKNNPYWSNYICFAHTLRMGSFDKQAIRKQFRLLVSQNEYDKKDKNQLLRLLYGNQKNTAEENV